MCVLQMIPLELFVYLIPMVSPIIWLVDVMGISKDDLVLKKWTAVKSLLMFIWW